jgi:hypothetical protein
MTFAHEQGPSPEQMGIPEEAEVEKPFVDRLIQDADKGKRAWEQVQREGGSVEWDPQHGVTVIIDSFSEVIQAFDEVKAKGLSEPKDVQAELERLAKESRANDLARNDRVDTASKYQSALDRVRAANKLGGESEESIARRIIGFLTKKR